MADNNPIRIGRTNNIESSNPGTGTVLERDANSLRTDPVFSVQNPVGGAVSIHGEASIGLSDDGVIGAGVRGVSAAGDGVRGASTNGVGVVGFSSNNDGVVGISTSFAGVFGVSTSFDGVSGDGVLGISTNGDGVIGSSSSSFGVRGSSSLSFGGFFQGPFSTDGSSGGLRVSGNIVKFNGEYSEALPHPDGSHRLLYASLSPESWYEDFGRGELVEGQGRVALDPDFAAIVGIDDGDYHVFLTPEGDSNGLFVSSRNPAAFEVQEQQGGISSLTFSYRVVAVNKRKDAQPERLAKVAEPQSIDLARPDEDRRQIDEVRRQVEEQRRRMEELRRRVGPQEEVPPETT